MSHPGIRTSPPSGVLLDTGDEDDLPPHLLAARYGLEVSGARPSLPAYTRQVWFRRHFVTAYATARLTSMYANARLGQLWQVMTPLLNAGVYYLIFGVLMGTRHTVTNFIPYLCTGVFVYSFTQASVLAGTRAVQGNLSLIRALHFPRACLPVALTLNQLQQTLFSTGVLAVIVLAFGEPLTVRWLLVPPVLVAQTLFNMGLALAMARVGAKYTDAAQLVPFVTRTWLYFSGVFYNLTTLTKHAPGWAGTLLEANPAHVYITLMRYALMRSVPASNLPPHVWVLAIGWALVIGIGGYVYFWQAEEEYGRG
ncbi:ABC transporter permease [Actinomadura harenae]|uniref:Transport permease protein n=1 Tax=Actinomadura harenae TaxID=2483351 RepID=A0A3M2MG42_9ACTN|nr:ABC transporter permease [Actinomadura harenae]RMI47823.1 ABC transporter permease [Actinomadura harenae]